MHTGLTLNQLTVNSLSIMAMFRDIRFLRMSIRINFVLYHVSQHLAPEWYHAIYTLRGEHVSCVHTPCAQVMGPMSSHHADRSSRDKASRRTMNGPHPGFLGMKVAPLCGFT